LIEDELQEFGEGPQGFVDHAAEFAGALKCVLANVD